jgi:photosystem II 10kDa protein
LLVKAVERCVICSLQGFGVYRFAKKYGANVDGYSPIYTPDLWSESGNSYKAGTKGLLAWCAP